MKIAIIGSGISGLTAAHHLDDRAEVTIFEADSRPGGHANTVVAESERGLESIDTGFIVFNDRNYPEFTRLLEELEVPSRPSKMSFSVSDGDFEYSGGSLGGLFARRRHLVDPAFLRMLAEFPRFQRTMRELAETPEGGPSLRELLDDEGFTPLFTEMVAIPLVSSVWSADPDQLWEFPAGFLAGFLANHGLLSLRDRPSWRTVEGGSRRYVGAITEQLRGQLRLSTPVELVRRTDQGIGILTAGGEETFDRVVVATHSDQALRLLDRPTADELAVLGAIPYQPNEAALHTDVALMPRRRAAWASWNYRPSDRSPGRTALTYDMNRLQGLDCRRRFLVSLNLTDRIDPGRLLGTFRYSHPVFTPDSISAQAGWSRISGVDRIHFCGAYWRNGFHEDGAFSGRRAAAVLASGWPEASCRSEAVA